MTETAPASRHACATARNWSSESDIPGRTGAISTREEQLQEARERVYEYERQDEDGGTQTVRVWGDTAVVTARLWIKGTSRGVPFNRLVWFSDTYVRTENGWQYFVGQASLHLPDANQPAP